MIVSFILVFICAMYIKFKWKSEPSQTSGTTVISNTAVTHSTSRKKTLSKISLGFQNLNNIHYIEKKSGGRHYSKYSYFRVSKGQKLTYRYPTNKTLTFMADTSMSKINILDSSGNIICTTMSPLDNVGQEIADGITEIHFEIIDAKGFGIGEH